MPAPFFSEPGSSPPQGWQVTRQPAPLPQGSFGEAAAVGQAATRTVAPASRLPVRGVGGSRFPALIAGVARTDCGWPGLVWGKHCSAPATGRRFRKQLRRAPALVADPLDGWSCDVVGVVGHANRLLPGHWEEATADVADSLFLHTNQHNTTWSRCLAQVSR